MVNKEAYYFPHDSNAQQDEKILALRMKFGWEGYGLYWALIEILRDATDYMITKDYNRIAFQLRVNASTVKSIVEDFGLFAFTDDGECLYSESLNRRMDIRDSKKKEFSINGIIGNLIKNKHLTKKEISNMTDEQIIEFNNNLKVLGGRSGGGREPTAIKEKEIKEKNNNISISDGGENSQKSVQPKTAPDRDKLHFLQLYIMDNCPEIVGNIKKQLTLIEANDLEALYGRDAVLSKIDALENRGDLSKYRYVGKTLKMWLDSDKTRGKNVSSQSNGKQKSANPKDRPRVDLEGVRMGIKEIIKQRNPDL